MPVLILIAIGFFAAVAWHRLLPDYWLATFGATVTTVVLFQGLAYLVDGKVDALIAIAVVIETGVAFAIAALVGLPIRSRRRKGEIGPSAL